MLKKLAAYLVVLGLALGVVAANRGLAQDVKPIQERVCCADSSDDGR